MIDPDKIIQIYNYTNSNEDFQEINYKTGLNSRLHAKRTFVKGELQKAEWYAYYDGLNYENKILDVDVIYNRDALGFADSRITTRTWYYEDGTPCDEKKITTKYYTDPVERIQEGKRRRGNLIDILMNNTMGLMIETMAADPLDPVEVGGIIQQGRDLMKEYQGDITAFIEESHTAFIDSLTNDTTHTWLDNQPVSLGGSTSIRNYLIAELTI